MLSAETSVGSFPVEAVSAMQRIITEVEVQQEIYYRFQPPQKDSANYIPENICYSAAVMAQQTDAEAIVAMTHSGMTAFKVAAQRPKAFIYIFTDNKPILNTLNLVWGVRGFYYDKYESTDRTISDIKQYLREKNLIEPGHFIIHIASTPLHERATANTIKLTQI
jgi:pyruvate kinase